MAARRTDAEIDRLYQLTPEEFTAARNALAKTAGADAAAVRKLARPPIAAWAVNQVYWQQRAVYDALITAAKELRQTHKAILSGKSSDLRGAGKAHDAAVDGALKAALSLLAAHGHPATDATRQAIATTLRALPADEPPGRLSRTLQPGGFEMLAGLSIAGGARVPAAERAPSKPAPPAEARGKGGKPSPREAQRSRERSEKPAPRVDPRVAARAREAAARAARELREAEHTARREQFEAARAAREADKAGRQLEDARKALAAAQQEFEEAESAAAEAARIKEAAEARAAAAEEALEAARARIRPT
jgi:hypothetical protein